MQPHLQAWCMNLAVAVAGGTHKAKSAKTLAATQLLLLLLLLLLLFGFVEDCLRTTARQHLHRMDCCTTDLSNMFLMMQNKQNGMQNGMQTGMQNGMQSRMSVCVLSPNMQRLTVCVLQVGYPNGNA